MGGRRPGLRCVTAPALDFGILTETKDSETATVESSFTVPSAYTAEDFEMCIRDRSLPVQRASLARLARPQASCLARALTGSLSQSACLGSSMDALRWVS